MGSLWDEGVRRKEEETWGEPGLRVLKNEVRDSKRYSILENLL